ncbi:FKBP-type peptidyl-prolyl cis-trans isomerase [Celerinatantimonas sp. YJH-8]|uniref:FKBP-type peptidyl-prolyl cis-trans isomerase n=1 Tax=Celerinatantimonas sp. YJH-8 TaxID=3228714 RepID=UPI0038BE91CE
MKKYFAVSLIAVSVLALSACQQQSNAASKVELKTDAQKQAYAIGASISGYVNSTLKQQESLGLKLDRDFVLAGMREGLADKSQLSNDEMKTVLQSLDKQMSTLAKEKATKDAAQAKADGEKFLAENAKKEGVVTTASGLQYQVLKEGDGPQPKLTDTVTVNYKGTLINGKQFDSSYDRGQPATFPLNRVISGWSEGVQLMHVGGKYRLFIPSKLAYGDTGAGSIPANSTLIFDVELLSIKDQTADKPAAE